MHRFAGREFEEMHRRKFIMQLIQDIVSARACACMHVCECVCVCVCVCVISPSFVYLRALLASGCVAHYVRVFACKLQTDIFQVCPCISI